jgi:methylated-DNA-[protein]-cysteine S-methyltransferase
MKRYDDIAAPTLSLAIDRLDTPVGDLVVAVDDHGRLRAVHFAPPPDLASLLRRACAVPDVRVTWQHDPAGCSTALRGYFAGDLDAIDQLRVAPAGTAFQQEVWRLLREVPCGTTTSYGEIAGRLGRPRASRAVGLANGANPIAIVIPCHRVVGADGSLTGYGGGLDRKRWLLAHEAMIHRPRLF